MTSLLRSFMASDVNKLCFRAKKCNFFTMVMYIDLLEKCATVDDQPRCCEFYEDTLYKSA